MLHSIARVIFSLMLIIVTMTPTLGQEEDALDQVDLPTGPFKIVGFGDSLMAGYKLDVSRSFTAQLEDKLRAKGYDVSVSNAGVTGDTTAGGKDRLEWSIPEGTNLVILELGANDMLSGINPESTKQNLDFMLTRLQQRHIPVILAGIMRAPKGGEKVRQPNPIYRELADKFKVSYYPFFLNGVSGNTSLELNDGMHPNEQGVSVMVDNFLPTIETILKKMGLKPTEH